MIICIKERLLNSRLPTQRKEYESNGRGDSEENRRTEQGGSPPKPALPIDLPTLSAISARATPCQHRWQFYFANPRYYETYAVRYDIQLVGSVLQRTRMRSGPLVDQFLRVRCARRQG